MCIIMEVLKATDSCMPIASLSQYIIAKSKRVIREGRNISSAI